MKKKNIKNLRYIFIIRKKKREINKIKKYKTKMEIFKE